MLLFDLDNTLYPRELGVVARIDLRINQYMATRLPIAAGEVDALRRRFWIEHGTTLRGLMSLYRIDPDDYLRYVHDIDLSDLLRPDPELRRILAELPGRKAVFSNACRSHAASAVDRLGISACFDSILALEDLGYVPKPLPEAFATALALLGSRPERCSLVEDTLSNLIVAKRLGMRTIWVNDSKQGEESVDFVISRIHEIEDIPR